MIAVSNVSAWLVFIWSLTFLSLATLVGLLIYARSRGA